MGKLDSFWSLSIEKFAKIYMSVSDRKITVSIDTFSDEFRDTFPKESVMKIYCRLMKRKYDSIRYQSLEKIHV